MNGYEAADRAKRKELRKLAELHGNPKSLLPMCSVNYLDLLLILNALDDKEKRLNDIFFVLQARSTY